MESVSNKKNIYITLLALALFLCCDRLLRNLFLWNCSYRMQTLNTLLSIAATLFLYVAFMYEISVHGFDFPRGILLPFCIIYAFYFIASAINPESGVLSRWADSFLFALGPLLFLSLAAYNQENWKRFIGAVNWLYIAIALLNILFILFPNLYSVMSPWRQNYFIGYHTFLVFPLTIGVLFALLDHYYNGSRFKLICYLLLFFVNQVLVKAAGGLIGAFILLLYFIPFVRRIIEKTDLAVFVGIVLVLFIILMWFMGPILNIAPVKHIIQDVLHRDLTLTGRLIIWPGVLSDVAKHPILGYGISTNGSIFYDTVYNTGWTGLDGVWLHAHNEFLQTLYEGGILTLLAAIGMLLFTAKKIRSCGNQRLSGIFKIIIFALLLMLQDDQVVYYPWYILAFVCQTAVLSCMHEKRFSN